jgi:hypothetical protein
MRDRRDDRFSMDDRRTDRDRFDRYDEDQEMDRLPRRAYDAFDRASGRSYGGYGGQGEGGRNQGFGQQGYGQQQGYGYGMQDRQQIWRGPGGISVQRDYGREDDRRFYERDRGTFGAGRFDESDLDRTPQYEPGGAYRFGRESLTGRGWSPEWSGRQAREQGRSELGWVRGDRDEWMRGREGEEDRGFVARAGDWMRRKLGKGPKGYVRSDERIREDVCDMLSDHEWIDASDVDVMVKDGEVTLTGLVQDRRTKRAIEDVTDDVRGVKEVHNQIRLRKETGASTNGDKNVQTTTTSTGVRTEKTPRA